MTQIEVFCYRGGKSRNEKSKGKRMRRLGDRQERREE
jgi:hypothetical protein